MRKLFGMAAIAAVSLTGAAATAQVVPQTVEVIGLARTIEPGEIVSEDDLGPVEVPLTMARQTADVAEVVGKEAKRRLEAGKPIRAFDVMEPQLVKKGQKVSLVVRKEGITITATGKALTSGASGDTVRVQNSNTYTLLEGEVAGIGVVQINPSLR